MEVSQDSKDSYILTSNLNHLSVGKVYHETRGITKFRLVVRDEILVYLVPHFKDYPLLGRKALQYSTWLKIVKTLAKEPQRTTERDCKVEILIKKLSNL